MNVQSFISGVLVTYLLVALMTGMAMSKAIPALNWIGATYVGATWPAAMFCAATIDCSVLPRPPLSHMMFSFSSD